MPDSRSIETRTKVDCIFAARLKHVFGEYCSEVQKLGMDKTMFNGLTDGVEMHSSAVSVGTDITPPEPARLIFALRQIGYSLEQALADLIDNSVNAKARKVLIRLLCDEDNIVSVAVTDDGCGMTESELRNAMRFGSDRADDPMSLGKFGMGLKLASLSHARTLTVLTRKGGQSFARKWTIEGIERGWECDILDSREAGRMLDGPWGGLDLKQSGTTVVWDRLDRLPPSSSGLRATLRTLQQRLQTHVGLHFHRFIEREDIKVILDQQRVGMREHGLQVEIEPLNPFRYEQSGHPEFPKLFEVYLEGTGKIGAEAHIWPPNSVSKDYSLGQNAAARQGIYFYRNERLIQAGGWNGIVKQNTEPHSSLARVKIDLPTSLDGEFGLNVQKSAVIVPPGFSETLATAKADGSMSFEQFRQTAQRVYRNKDERASKDLPVGPGRGVPAALQRLAWELLFPEAEEIRPVDFVWSELEPDYMFEIDSANQAIVLNALYRRELQRGARVSRVDSPVFKIMLLFLVEQDLFKERLSQGRKRRLDKLSRLLAGAIRGST